jgi:hypothetical protein
MCGIIGDDEQSDWVGGGGANEYSIPLSGGSGVTSSSSRQYQAYDDECMGVPCIRATWMACRLRGAADATQLAKVHTKIGVLS